MAENDYIKKSKVSDPEMERKLEELRSKVATKLTGWADRIQVSMAFTPKIERIEGERWSENGKTYVMKNGYKESVSVLQGARMPWWCPECSRPMNHRFDRKFYYLRGCCFDCNIEREGKMRLNGTWEAFERRTMRENEKAQLRDKIAEHIDYIRTFKTPQVHFQDGRWEELASVDMFEALFGELEKDIERCQKRLDIILKEEQEESNGNS